MTLDARELDAPLGAAADTGVSKGYQLNAERPETQLMRRSSTAKHVLT